MSNVIASISQDPEGTVVALTGEIDLHQAPGFHQKLVDLCAQKPVRMIVEMSQVTYIDSSGVGSLVEIFRRLNKERRKLILVAPSARVSSVLEITRLDQFFTIVATLEQARAL